VRLTSWWSRAKSYRRQKPRLGASATLEEDEEGQETNKTVERASACR
jgi:hypothetical protein